MTTPDAWDPDRYARFGKERRQAWDDLVALLSPLDRPRILDLGCGDGALTTELPARGQ
jgi:trans-aconitate methyltransferase